MNWIKIRNTCDGCPYLQTPAVDLHEVDQYYTCRLTYANTYDLEHFQEICPLKTIQNVLADFICYHISNGYDLDLKKEKKIIKSFIDNYFFGVD